MMNRNTKLLKNIFYMFWMFFLPKTFGFLLIPIYTSYLTTSEYGISDIILSTASLICPIILLATPSAVMRFTIENKEDVRPFQISFKICLIGIIIFLFLGNIVTVVFKIDYSLFIYLFFIVVTSSVADIFLSYTKAMERTKLLSYCGVFSCLVGILCNILFIVVFRFGLYGFLLATIFSYLFSIIFLFINNKIFKLFKNFNLKKFVLEKEILSFSIPLVFSGLSWWVISFSDRYIIAIFCGAAANGIYSVATKIPIIIQSIDNVFSQAWIFTLYDSYKDNEGKRYITKVNEVYIFILMLSTSILLFLTIPLAEILFTDDFYYAWKIVPPLLLSMVCLCAQGLISNFFSIYKKTKISMFITIFISVVNCVLNIVLIKITNDPIGAAISSSISFFVGAVICYVVVIKISSIEIKFCKQLICFLLLVVQSIYIEFYPDAFIYSVVFLGLIMFVNLDNCRFLLSKATSLAKRLN